MLQGIWTWICPQVRVSNYPIYAACQLVRKKSRYCSRQYLLSFCEIYDTIGISRTTKIFAISCSKNSSNIFLCLFYYFFSENLLLLLMPFLWNYFPFRKFWKIQKSVLSVCFWTTVDLLFPRMHTLIFYCQYKLRPIQYVLAALWSSTLFQTNAILQTELNC